MSPSTPTDAEVIAASLAEPTEFAPLVDRHLAAIYGYLRRRTCEELAEELCAETFAEAFDHRAKYSLSRSNALPWLYGIAANLLRHHRRAEARRLLAYARSAGEQAVESQAEHSAARVDARGVRPQLAAALAGLNRRNREVLLLFAWADLSYDEIGEALDIPVGTVRSRLNRARQSVRKALEASGHDSARHNSSSAVDSKKDARWMSSI
jgi:RNA polymerase sigma-70 factor (ECF subfamily)